MICYGGFVFLATFVALLSTLLDPKINKEQGNRLEKEERKEGQSCQCGSSFGHLLA
jgi:hypothetical protein